MPKRPNTSSPLVVLIAVAVVVAALYVAKAIFLPISLAILLSFLLTPLANRVERWGLPRIPAVLVVGGMSFTVIGMLIWIVAVQAIDLGSNVETYTANLAKKVTAIGGETGPVGQMLQTFNRVQQRLIAGASFEPGANSPAVDSPQEEPAAADKAVEVKVVENTSPLKQIGEWLGSLVAPLPTAGLVVVLVLFMLVDREGQRNRLIELFGTQNLNLTTEALTDAGRRVTSFLRTQFLINASYGMCVGVALFVLGVPSAIMWGVLGFMLRFLPYIGPILAAILPIGVSAAVSPGWTQPLLVGGWFIVLELVLNNLIEPWLYGNSIGVSAVGIMVSAIFWTWLWGPIGLLLAMPLTVCLIVVSRYVPQLRFVSVLLSDQPALSPAEQTYQRLLARDDHEIERVARLFLKTADRTRYYDDVLIPAISMAERDRHADLLSEEQETFVIEAVEELIEDLAAATTPRETDEEHDEPPATSHTGTRVLCIPLRDRADHLVALMLAQLLAAEGIHVDVGSTDTLSGEQVEEVERLNSQISVISILPPCAPRNSRLLCRRLRRGHPNLPIIIGYWSTLDFERLQQSFDLEANDKLVTRLSDCVEAVKTASLRFLRVDEPQQQPVANKVVNSLRSAAATAE